MTDNLYDGEDAQHFDAPAQTKTLHSFGQPILPWQAAEHLLGEKMLVRRAAWPQGAFVYFAPPVTFLPEAVQALARHYKPGGNLTMQGFIAMADSSGVHRVWYPTTEDMESYDWTLIGAVD